MPELQTLTTIAKIDVDDSGALVLGLLGHSATKLWNTALWDATERWNNTGKIPAYQEQAKRLKSNRWYKNAHAQTSQAVLEEQWQAHKSWFALRKTDPKANPPKFRKKTTVSTVTFKKDSIRLNGETLQVGVPEKVYGRKYLSLKLHFPPTHRVTTDNIQVVRVVCGRGEFFAHIVHRVVLPEAEAGGHVLAVDLGICRLAGTACTDGKSELYSGGELLALERYFEKEKSKCTESRSRKCFTLNSKRSRQRKHLLHALTRNLVRDAKARGVSTIVVGDLQGIRTDKEGEAKQWGRENQKLHAWPYAEIVRQITYKARLEGMAVEQVSERYSSQICCACGKRRKANRIHRGVYQCKTCGVVVHADINGAWNILKTYLRGAESLVTWSSGGLAPPTVNRFAWRNTTPIVHEPGTWIGVPPTAAANHRRAA